MMSGCCSKVYASLFRSSSSVLTGCPTGQRLLHSANSTSAPKSALAKLRKKTGYSLSLCKQALEANEQDVARAQNWLKVRHLLIPMIN